MLDPLDDNAPFIAPHGDRWLIVRNADHCDADGNHGMRSITIGKAEGYRTYHEAADALREEIDR